MQETAPHSTHHTIPSWGEALRIRASSRGLRTQKELAAATGASMSTIGAWCAAKHCPEFRMGYDHMLLDALQLDSIDQLHNLHHLIANQTERQRRIRRLLKDAQPLDIPIGVIIVSLVQHGVTADLIDLVVDQICHKSSESARNAS